MCLDVASDLARLGIELPGVESLEKEVFQFMASRGCEVREHRRVSMCRFAASVAAAEFHLTKWNIDKYETLTFVFGV